MSDYEAELRCSQDMGNRVCEAGQFEAIHDPFSRDPDAHMFQWPKSPYETEGTK